MSPSDNTPPAPGDACALVRDRLLDHLYGALDDADEALVVRHLRECPACSAARDVASGQRALLGAAASEAADDVAFATPKPAKAPLIPGKWWTRSAAAAAILVATGAVLRAGELASIETAHLRVDIEGSRRSTASLPAEYRVKLSDLGGAPRPAEVEAILVRNRLGTRTPIATAKAGPDGVATITLPPGLLEPGERADIAFAMRGSPNANHTDTMLPVIEGTRIVTRASTDKPLYRPGEVVRLRAVALESLRLTPASDASLRVKILDPRGGVAFDRELATTSGVTAWEHQVPEDAPGGRWKVVVEAPTSIAGSPVAPAEAEFDVRRYRVPRLRFDLALDRTSFHPGDEGRATVQVTRTDGKAPDAAMAEAVVRLDGREIARQRLPLSQGGGMATFPFRLPSSVEDGRADVTVTVEDGGTVETTAKTIPIVLDRVKIETFPEGGALVAGLGPQRIYVRATTPQGEPADVTFDVSGRGTGTSPATASFRTDVRGMGVFEWTPTAHEPGLSVDLADLVFAVQGDPGTKVVGPTPSIADSGASLRALDAPVAAGAPVRVRVASTTAGRHRVAVWCRGTEIGSAAADLAAGVSADVAVPLRTDAGGVLRVTVFDPKGAPVAERLVAREVKRRLDIGITAEVANGTSNETPGVGFAAPAVGDAATLTVTPGRRVGVRFDVRDEKGAPAQAILGASVVDEGVLSLAGDVGAASLPVHFLLGMEVEKLEEAAVYTGTPGAARAVDLLLGVQGWRRFAWRSPAELAEKRPLAAARIAPVGIDETPLTWSNVGILREAVDSAAGRVNREWSAIGFLAAFAAVLLTLGTLFVRGIVTKRPWVAATTGLVALGGVGLVVSSITCNMTESVKLAAAPGEAAIRLRDGIIATATSAPGSKSEEKSEWEAGDEPGALMGGVKPGGYGEAESEEAQAADTAAGDDGRARIARLEERIETKKKQRGASKNDGSEGLLRDLDGDDALYLVAAREYAHRADDTPGVRDDFTEVLYWRPLIVTDAQGTARVEFDTSDALTQFRISAEAHDGRGALGASHVLLTNRQALSAEPKLPQAISTGDIVQIPLVVANDGGTAADVTLRASANGPGRLASSDASLSLAAGARGRSIFELTARDQDGPLALSFDADAGAAGSDRVVRKIAVERRGYPFPVHRSGVLETGESTAESTMTFDLPAEMTGDARGGLRIYPSTVSTFVDGLEGMLRDPSGCFEQVSSTNYPNILVLDLLRDRSGDGAPYPPALASRAQKLLASGYAKLAGYESKGGGFEWFGGSPAHEVLTAYGLLEFTDMKRVFDVDQAMVARTRTWLLSRRDGSGGFRREAAHGGWGAAPQDVTNTYIVWALAESGEDPASIRTEINAVVARGLESSDPYLVALAANTALAAKRPEGAAIVSRLRGMQKTDGAFGEPKSTVVRSGPHDAVVETTALAALAFTRSADRSAEAEAACRALLERRQSGTFGATQATVLALRALAAQAKSAAPARGDRDIEILVNGVRVASRSVSANAVQVVQIPADELRLTPGANRIVVRGAGTGNGSGTATPMPWSLALDLRTPLPPSDADCALGLETSLGDDPAAAGYAEGDAATLAVTLTNRRDAGLPMALVRVGLPAGLEPRADRLEEMKRAGTIDFYELRSREVTLYFRELAPNAVRRLAIECLATIPGTYEAPASSAYLYYTPDAKTWVRPVRATISAR